MDAVAAAATDPEALLAKGALLMKDGAVDDAVTAFGEALQYSTMKYGEEGAQCCKFYYAYGDALLKAVESMGEIFGGGVPEDKPDPDDAEAQAQPIEEDIELAWEMLEVARLGYSKQLEAGKLAGAERLKAQSDIAEVFSRLGDLSQLNDQFDKAKSDYEAALKWLVESLGMAECVGAAKTEALRDVASQHWNLTRALQYNDPPQFANALEHTKMSLEFVDKLLAHVATQGMPEKEVADIKSMRADMAEKEKELLEAIEGSAKPHTAAAGSTAAATACVAADATAPAAPSAPSAGSATAAPKSGTTTIGFGSAPTKSGTTTIGFGSAPTKSGTTTIGFGSAPTKSGTTTIGFGSAPAKKAVPATTIGVGAAPAPGADVTNAQPVRTLMVKKRKKPASTGPADTATKKLSHPTQAAA